MRHELAANERDEQQRGGKNQGGDQQRDLGVVEVPVKLARVLIAHPLKGLVHPLAHTAFEPQGAHNGNECKREDQSANQRDRHRVRHWLEEFCRRTGERVNRQVAGNNDCDGIEDGAVDILRRREDDFFKVVTLAFALTQLAKDVFHHHESAVNQNPKVDRSNRKQIGGHAPRVQENKRKEQCQWNRKSDDHRGANANQETHQHDEDERHPQQHVVSYRVDGELNKVATIVIREHLDVGWQNVFIELPGFLLYALQHVLCLLAAAHHDDALNRVIRLVEAEFTQAGSVPDRDVANIVNAHRCSILRANHDFADIGSVAD